MENVIQGGKRHEFAFFIPYLTTFVTSVSGGEELVLTDEKIFHRMANVVRLQPSDECILFDQTIHVHFVISSFVGKKQIRGIVHTKVENRAVQPQVTFFLPLLKRDDLDNALYSLAEVGVTTIQLIQTQKSQRTWNQRELEHAHKVIIGAAEQSKHFSYPVLESPIPIESAVKNAGTTKIFFDPKGQPFFEVMCTMYTQHQNKISLLIGPEGDLTQEEKTLIEKNDFIFCALTPTILRSSHAAALGAGFVRSIFTDRSL